MYRSFLTFFLFSAALTGISAANITARAPKPGAVNVAVNAQIVIQFSTSATLGTDSCFLNGEHIVPSSFSSTIAIFQPGLMEYGTKYTLEVRKGAFVTKSDGEPFDAFTTSFTTKSPEMRLFDAIVAKDATGDYTSIRAAVKAAPTGRSNPWLIFVKNGTYEELVRMSKGQSNIVLVGEDMEKTILKYSITASNHGDYKDAEGQSPVLVMNGKGLYLQNMTVIDSWGYEKQAGPQALALGSYGDKLTMFKTKLYSYQDTWQTGGDECRAYAKKCYVEGAVDFIYCSGDLVLDSCTIGLCRNGSVIVAPSHGAGVKYGYVFRDCNIVSSKPGTARTNNTFGRPWHNSPRASFINTTLSKDITFSEGGWIDHMGGLPVVFAEYNTMYWDGRKVDLSKRITSYWKEVDGKRIYSTAKAILTKEEADALTVRNVLSGNDAWRPDVMVRQLSAPVVTFKNDQLKWNANPQAICYEIIRNGAFQQFTTDTVLTVEGDAKGYRVCAVNAYGTLGIISEAPSIDGIQANRTIALDANFSHGKLSITGFSGKASVVLYTLCGVQAGQYTLDAPGEIDVDVSGLFLVRVTSESSQRTFKFVN